MVDALSSEGLAGIDGAPVLVTDSRTLSSQTKHVIETLGAKRAVVVGGPESVSDSVVSDLEALLGSRPERVAGADAQATSRAVYHARDTWAKTAFVATSSTFQDALSVTPYAFNKIFVGKRNAHVEKNDIASFRKRFVIRRFIDVFPCAFAAVGKVYRSFYAVRLYELFGIRGARITVDGIARSVQAAGRNASRFYFAEIGKNFLGCIVASVFAFFKLADFIVE